ncbi:MAG: DUF5076 domain-containing protein [Planctomycetota bacterium]|nr:DUF5076 domain-containing protein [Planctomycetota bacterium]
MFGKRHHDNELEVPSSVAKNSAAVEVLRVWAPPGQPQQFVLRTTWKNPAAWGLLLVDVARQAASAYAAEGHDREAVILKIRELWDAEFANPTDSPEG